MVQLVLIGSAADKRIFSALKNVLQSHYSLCYMDEQRFYSSASNPDFLIVQNSSLCDIQAEQGIVIFKEAVEAVQPLTFGESLLAVVNASNPQGVALVAKSNLQAIPCGLCAKDTLTLSSITTDSACVCLQRSITTLGGNTLEPVELPLRLTEPTDPYTVLAVAAALLLCDCGTLLQTDIF